MKLFSRFLIHKLHLNVVARRKVAVMPRVQDSNTECSSGSQLTPIISSRKDRHVTRMTLMDRAATSQAPSQELGLFAKQVSARTIRRPLQQHRLSARKPWLRLP
ncbi:HTH_Tnp_Tc3_2 domain-containing protein [Trichonephila clavipes]|uniref:HTH_Tnp_Tc3_2 domain-containing protein n=1 Tax=Trichonephila clavipes TaxID=2585209 RepID=A0A8X6SU46_TRICX|nr:HTH_Tnp_Tc3_2 domain-containing protein [Trichonephila clavipes]